MSEPIPRGQDMVWYAPGLTNLIDLCYNYWVNEKPLMVANDV